MGANQGGANYYHGSAMQGNGATGYQGYGAYQTNSNSISCIIQPVNGVGGLYLGDINAAQNYQLLQSLGIKAVLTAAVQANVHYDYSIIPYHLLVNAKDTSSFNLVEYFDQAIDFTRRSLKSTNVLIHCMAGVSRSATLLIAYLMTDRGISYENAITFVRQCRPIINPNSGFQKQLKQYEAILSQRRLGNLRGSMAYANSPRNNLNMNYGMTPFSPPTASMNQFRYSGVQEGFY